MNQVKLQPYHAVDLETSGLFDVNLPVPQVLEIACVYDDGVTPIDQLRTFNVGIHHNLIQGPPEALCMNHDLIKMMCGQRERDIPFMTLEKALEELTQFILQTNPIGTPVVLAGKNIAGFDLPVLKKNNWRPDTLMQISHRTIDLGSMYFPEFGYMPGLSEINKITGRSEVTHRALSDCMDIVQGVRHKVLGALNDTGK